MRLLHPGFSNLKLDKRRGLNYNGVRMRVSSLSTLFCGLLALFVGALPASAGWAVYELKFVPDEENNLNFHFYSGAYVVAPLTGGPASIVLTTEADGRFYAVSEEAARVFTAANAGKRRTVLSALALNGSAQAAYTASGLVNHTISVPGPQGLRSYRVAGALKGTLVASDDDSEAAGIAADGSVGMVGAAKIEGKLRDDLSYNASHFATQADVVLYLVGLLEHYGYTADGAQPESEPAPATVEGSPAAPVENSPAPEGGADPALFPPLEPAPAPAAP